jgi:hypothetical protein
MMVNVIGSQVWKQSLIPAVHVLIRHQAHIMPPASAELCPENEILRKPSGRLLVPREIPNYTQLAVEHDQELSLQ